MSLESFYAKFNNLIKSVKQKKHNSKVFLCSATPPPPPGDTDVTGINTVILQLCQENNLSCIDWNAYFFYDERKTEVKYHFYTPRDSVHLSRSGIRRLLGAINEHVTVVENFHKCVFASHKPQQPPITLT